MPTFSTLSVPDISLAKKPIRSTLALVLAPDRRTDLQALAESGCSAELPFVHGVRLIDFQLANLVNAGVQDVIVVQSGHRCKVLQRHVAAAWGTEFKQIICLEGPSTSSLRNFDFWRGLAVIKSVQPDHVLLVSADHVCEPDLERLVQYHRVARVGVTVATYPMSASTCQAQDGLSIQATTGLSHVGAGIIDMQWLQDQVGYADAEGAGRFERIVVKAARSGELKLWQEQTVHYWRPVIDLDAYRVTWLDFMGNPSPPCALPTLPTPQGVGTEGQEPMVNAPESIILPGASVDRGAHIFRAIVAPGAHVPDGMVIGQDVELDAQRFYRTAAGTTLVTAKMLEGLIHRPPLRPSTSAVPDFN